MSSRGLSLISSLLLVMSIGFCADMTLNQGQCINITTSASATIYTNGSFVSIDNSSPVYVICMRNVTQQTFRSIIGTGDVYFNQTEFCSVNITSNNQEKCTKSAVIAPGSNYTYVDSNCDLHFSSSGYTSDQLQNVVCPTYNFVNYTWNEYLSADGNYINYDSDDQISPIIYPYNITINGTQIPNTFSITIPRIFTCPIKQCDASELHNPNLDECYQFLSQYNATDINAFAFTRWVNTEDDLEVKNDLLLACESDKSYFETMYNMRGAELSACNNNNSFYNNQYISSQDAYSLLFSDYKSIEEEKDEAINVGTTNTIIGILVSIIIFVFVYLGVNYYNSKRGWGNQ